MSPTTSPDLMNSRNASKNESQHHSPIEELSFDQNEPLFAEPFWTLPIPIWEPIMPSDKSVGSERPKSSTELMAGEIFAKHHQHEAKDYVEGPQHFASHSNSSHRDTPDWSAKQITPQAAAQGFRPPDKKTLHRVPHTHTPHLSKVSSPLGPRRIRSVHPQGFSPL